MKRSREGFKRPLPQNEHGATDFRRFALVQNDGKVVLRQTPQLPFTLDFLGLVALLGSGEIGSQVVL